MRSLLRAPARIMVLVIVVYQKTFGRLLAGRCRFHPSCSAYAVEAIETRGALRGGAAAMWRLMRCGPWTAGGIDPVGASRRAHSPAREVARG